MKDRRSLVEGMKPETSVDRSLEEHFVTTGKPKPDRPKQHQDQSPVSEIREGKGPAGDSIGRAPFTTRIRADFAAALKRASLQRQLDGMRPNTLQDILEEALELRSNGYLH